MSENVLITGGTGLIGSHLSALLRQRGHSVTLLSRSKSGQNKKDTAWWDPAKGIIDADSISNATCVVHLAGSNIASRIWTKKGRRSILESRISSAQLLVNSFRNHGNKLKTYITASGVNYYGSITTDHIFSESDPPSGDFLGDVCRKWEQAAGNFSDSGVRSIMIRTAVVLAKRDSVLQKLKTPFQMGLGTYAGTGNQYFPWIHIDDLCHIYAKAIEDINMSGPYNAVAPGHITVKDFVIELARSLNRKIILPPVPALVLKILPEYGTRLLLEGSRISSARIREAGFSFRFGEIKNALADLLKTGS